MWRVMASAYPRARAARRRRRRQGWRRLSTTARVPPCRVASPATSAQASYIASLRRRPPAASAASASTRTIAVTGICKRAWRTYASSAATRAQSARGTAPAWAVPSCATLPRPNCREDDVWRAKRAPVTSCGAQRRRLQWRQRAESPSTPTRLRSPPLRLRLANRCIFRRSRSPALRVRRRPPSRDSGSSSAAWRLRWPGRW